MEKLKGDFHGESKVTHFDPMILRGRKPHPAIHLLSNSNRERRVVPDKRD